MTNSLKWLVLASLANLVGNGFGTMLALQYNLTGDFGGLLNGQDVLRDFLTFKGTALSAPLPFMLIQLGLTILALRPGRSGRRVLLPSAEPQSGCAGPAGGDGLYP